MLVLDKKVPLYFTILESEYISGNQFDDLLLIPSLRGIRFPDQENIAMDVSHKIIKISSCAFPLFVYHLHYKPVKFIVRITNSVHLSYPLVPLSFPAD